MASPLSIFRTLFLAVSLCAIGSVLALPQSAPENGPGLTPSQLIKAAETGEIRVVPGPGLPSLESLNLTSRDLAVRALERIERLQEVAEDSKKLSNLTKRYTPTCETSPNLNGGLGFLCYEYLHSIGNTICAVPATGSRFCHTTGGSPDVAWRGRVNWAFYAESSCANVAEGGLWVLNECRSYWWAAPAWYALHPGTHAALGNDNLVVEIGPL
ncbi:hypothetical protein CC1G_09990 [Coprinopsis cinerea okayama7|uniref:Secreted protein n=1 Tax=Coprinopsis cinerea (strain Okayama-7 / 130 / ATCC MYA-4618 / FGSC 9003) TaxID=240176 RepID=A8NDH9_COPC7|nr:hypothetical protein CC1G_09990 [Coprinopsis cinerea okayama7\|eukprot:XP_001832776.2 hypothetical protein CC1G_09990 [Coprinopsis cinerea okayama7\